MVIRPTCLLLGGLVLFVPACTDATGPNAIRFLNAAQVVAGDDHTCYLDIAGVGHCWGWGRLGQLGDGDTLTRKAPVQVVSQVRFEVLAAGSSHTCGVGEGGEASCWGSAFAGELGNGMDQGRVTLPALVVGGIRFSTISVGDGHTCAITGAGIAHCWGEGNNGQLGSASAGNHTTPTLVATSETFSSIAAGQQFTCAVSTSNDAYCWGDNTWGQLGIGSTGGVQATPVKVVGGHRFASIQVGKIFACGLTTSDEAFCWGSGSFGRLGIGLNIDSVVTTPAAVAGGHKFRSLSLGRDHACGVSTENEAFCWGLNTYGKLGDRIGASSLSPNPVGGGLDFRQVSVGVSHTCAVTTGGVGYCWGLNIAGQLGREGISRSTDPLRVFEP